MKDPNCKNCIALTSGDCGQHEKCSHGDYYNGHGNKLDCPVCKIPTQEPMEWESEIENLCKYKLDKGMDLYSTAELKQFISELIKQAEERHNQDCTREEWARHMERERILKAIKSEEDILKSPHNDEWYIHFNKVIILINQNNE